MGNTDKTGINYHNELQRENFFKFIEILLFYYHHYLSLNRFNATYMETRNSKGYMQYMGEQLTAREI